MSKRILLIEPLSYGAHAFWRRSCDQNTELIVMKVYIDD